MSSKSTTLELCRKHLYDDKDQMAMVPVNIRERIIRIRSAYTLKLDFPRKNDKELAQHLMSLFGVQKSTAYDDIRLIKDLLGSINKNSKDWERYKTNQWLEEAVQIARVKNDQDSIIKAAAVSGKINQLDKDDPTEFDWDSIKPQAFKITGDPSVIGLKPIPNLKDKISSLLKKYQEDISMVEDVTFEEIDLDPLNDALTEANIL